MSNVAEQRTNYLELFFDLVLVFAITQLATLLHEVPHHVGHVLAGWGEVGLLSAMIWWLWSQFAWLGTSGLLGSARPRILMLGLTGLMLVAAILIPVATAPGISIFGIAYALIKLGALFLYRMETLGDSKHTAAVRSYVTKASIAPLIVFFASALAPEWRVTAWTLALAIEIGSALLVGNHVFRIHASHFAERHSLVLIIVLGEAVVALGGQAVAAELTAPGIAGLFGGFMLVATLWWSYFAWAGDSTEQWLKGHGRPFSPQDHAAPSRMARDAFTFGHFPLVAGIIAIAVGLKDLAAEPLHAWHPEARVAMAVGLVLYLGGFVAVVFRGNGYILWERLVALIAMVVTTLVSPLPAGGTAVLLGAELVTAIALEMRRWNRIMAAKA